MTPGPQELFTSPDHYLHSFDGADAIFVPMDRAAYRRSIFLDDRIDPASEASWRVAMETLIASGDAAPSRVAWIFHVAHCGSTLLARALGELGEVLVLREPLALRQAAVARDVAVLRVAMRMLGKRYPGGGAPVVKANVPVNFAIPEIAAAMPDAPAIFLYYGIEDYLPAILRSDNHRAWLRRVTGELASVLGDGRAVSDAERAAALWLAQMRMFAAGLAAMPRGRSLDAERLFAEPRDVLQAAAGLFDIDAPAAQVAAVTEGPLFATYAKNPSVAFANADRIARRNALRVHLDPELSAARTWLARNAHDLDRLVEVLATRRLA